MWSSGGDFLCFAVSRQVLQVLLSPGNCERLLPLSAWHTWNLSALPAFCYSSLISTSGVVTHVWNPTRKGCWPLPPWTSLSGVGGVSSTPAHVSYKLQRKALTLTINNCDFILQIGTNKWVGSLSCVGCCAQVVFTIFTSQESFTTSPDCWLQQT